MSEAPTDKASLDVKSHAASGFFHSGIAQVTTLITQFTSVIIMARILDPSDFGVMAMVMPIYAFACIFGDLGINQALIQRPKITSGQISSLFWFTIVIGVCSTLLLILMSPLVGWFYEDKRTITLTIAMATLVTVGALGNQHGALMVRNMQFKSQAIVTVTSAVMGLISTIVFGLILENYWALFIGMAASNVTATICVWLFIDWRPERPAWAEGSKDMIRYGLGITSANFNYFLVQNLSIVIIGKAFGEYALGLYDRAGKLLASPLQQLVTPLNNVIAPILYRLHDDDEKYKNTFLRTTASLLFFIAPGVIWASMFASPLILLLLGEKWAETIPLFALLSIAGLPQLINNAPRWLLITQGRSGDFARWSLFNGVATMVALLIGIQYGLMGVAVARVIHQFSVTPIFWWFACRQGPVGLLTSVRFIAPCAVSLCAMAAVLYFWISFAGDGFLSLAGGLVIAYVATTLFCTLSSQGRSILKKDFEFGLYLVKNILQKFKRAPQA